MRKFTIVLMALACLGIHIQTSAQVMCYYEMSVSQGEYAPANNSVSVLPEATNSDFGGLVFDNNGAQSTMLENSGYNIGFNFKYDNQEFSRFALASNGYVVLGKTDGINFNVPASYNIGYVFSNCSHIFGVVLDCDLARTDSTDISYLLSGTEGNHVLTIDYKNLQVTQWGSPIGNVSLQYHLYEATGAIDFVFKGFAPDPNSYMRAQTLKIGLAGEVGDVLLKDGNFDDDVVSSSAYGLSWSSYSYPANGLTYTWTQPKSCETPTAQPTGLQLSSSSNSISGEFSAQAEGDHYLILLDRQNKLTEMPNDGQNYNIGDSLGSARVIGYTTDGATFATSADLYGNTKYYVYVMAANSSCIGGPKYNTTQPLTDSITTLPSAPSSLTIIATDTTSIQCKAIANDNNDSILVAMTDKYATTGSGALDFNPAFDIPTGNYNIGDKLGNDAKVIFKGKAEDFSTVENLKANSLYHFRAWTMGSNGNYSSTAVTASTATASKMPWEANLSRYPMQAQPAGWHFDNANWKVTKNTSWGATDTAPYIENTDIYPATDPTDTWIETPDIYLSKGINRLIFALQLNEYVGYSKQPITFGDSDSLMIQLTKDGGKTYDTLQVYNKDNMPTMTDVEDYHKFYVTFYKGAGSMARLRILFHFGTEHKTVNARLREISLEEKGSCDYPINLTVIDSTIVGGEAAIKWEQQGEEDAWQIRYKKSEDSSWGKAFTVRTNPYVLTGLDGLTSYDVQVRALCSETEHSKWSEMTTFKSGLSVPFTEDFTSEKSEPSGWMSKTGELASPTVMTDGGNFKFSSDYWSTSVNYSSYDENGNGWYISPVLDLGDGSYTYDVTFKISAGTSRADSTALCLVVAKDGENFFANDTIVVLKNNSLTSGEYSASLQGYTGKIRLGFYFMHKGGNYRNLSLENVGVKVGTYNSISTTPSAIHSYVKGNVLHIGSADSNALQSIQVYDMAGRLLQQNNSNIQDKLIIKAKGQVLIRMNTKNGSKMIHTVIK